MNHYDQTKAIPKAFVINDLLKQYESMDKATPEASEFSEKVGMVNALEEGHDIHWYCRKLGEM